MSGPDAINVALFQLFRQFSNLQLRCVGSYQGQGLILIQLMRQGTLTQRQLSAITKRRSATLSEQLENMEHAGLILRKKSADDRRNVDVELTEAGVQAAVEAELARQEAADSMFAGLSEEEKQTLQAILTKLVSSIDREIGNE